MQALTHIPGAAGYVLPDMTMEAVDAAGNVLPSGQNGLLRTRSPCGVAGYLGDEAATRAVFRDGWFYSGDIGTVTPDGMLIIAGREKSVVNLGGDKINPELLERVLTAFAAVADAAAFAIPNRLGIDELWAAVVWRGGAADEKALRAHCESNLPANVRPMHYLAVAALARNDAGKLDRRRLPELARS